MNNEVKVVNWFGNAKTLGELIGLDVDVPREFDRFRVSNKDGGFCELFDSAEATYAFVQGLSMRCIIENKNENESNITYRQAVKSIEMFDLEYIGQNVQTLWESVVKEVLSPTNRGVSE